MESEGEKFDRRRKTKDLPFVEKEKNNSVFDFYSIVIQLELILSCMSHMYRSWPQLCLV